MCAIQFVRGGGSIIVSTSHATKLSHVNRSFALCNGIPIPDSGFRDIFTYGIRNRGLWNPVPGLNPESRIQDYLGLSYMGRGLKRSFGPVRKWRCNLPIFLCLGQEITSGTASDKPKPYRENCGGIREWRWHGDASTRSGSWCWWWWLWESGNLWRQSLETRYNRRTTSSGDDFKLRQW